MFCNCLNLQLKINKVIKRIFTVIVISAFIFSCTDATDKTGTEKEDRVIESEKQETVTSETKDDFAQAQVIKRL